MKRRPFLKLIAAASTALYAKFLPTPRKKYITIRKFDELVGVKFEWPKNGPPNPEPGSDWVIISRADSPLKFEGEWITNPLMDKYWGIPLGKSGEMKLFCFSSMSSDRSRADLSNSKFYIS